METIFTKEDGSYLKTPICEYENTREDNLKMIPEVDYLNWITEEDIPNTNTEEDSSKITFNDDNMILTSMKTSWRWISMKTSRSWSSMKINRWRLMIVTHDDETQRWLLKYLKQKRKKSENEWTKCKGNDRNRRMPFPSIRKHFKYNLFVEYSYLSSPLTLLPHPQISILSRS